MMGYLLPVKPWSVPRLLLAVAWQMWAHIDDPVVAADDTMPLSVILDQPRAMP